jgi:HEAT repeat protein
VEDGASIEETVVFEDALNPVIQLQQLLGRLIVTMDDDLYLMEVRQAVDCSDELATRNQSAAIFPLAELLTDHANDPDRGERLRKSARFGLEQLARGNNFLEFLLVDRMEQEDGLSHEASLAVLTAAGPRAVGLIVEKMGAIDILAQRKILSTLLVCLGESAVPAILKMMGDNRWHVVRNLTAILGDIGTREAIPELQKCLLHSDIRVCKEAVRSLAKIGGRVAESAIIEVLRGNDTELFPQVVASLGGMKSRNALVELLNIVCSPDIFLQHLQLKIDALGAIAMIGDRQVVPILADILAKGHIVVPGRWKQFKIAVVGCLARLGDSRALPILKYEALHSNELGQACAEAVEIIERTGGGQHGAA